MEMDSPESESTCPQNIELSPVTSLDVFQVTDIPQRKEVLMSHRLNTKQLCLHLTAGVSRNNLSWSLSTLLLSLHLCNGKQFKVKSGGGKTKAKTPTCKPGEVHKLEKTCGPPHFSF